MSCPSLTSELSSISQGTNGFGLKLYKELIQHKPKENLVLSAFSVASLLSLASLAAGGSTLSELKEVLSLPEEKETLLKAYSSFLRTFEELPIEWANGIFLHPELKLRTTFMETAISYFKSEIQVLDYRYPEAASKELNDWITIKTHDRIKDLFRPNDIGLDTKSIFVNTIYFNGNWEKTFEAELTKERSFHVSPELSPQVPTMFAEAEFRVGFSEDLNVDMIALPYEGKRLEMIIFLPRVLFGLEDLESRLTKDIIDDALKELEGPPKTQRLYFPKFNIHSTQDIKAGLQGLGITHLFQSSCDLSGLAPGHLQVSDLVQKTFIDVKEEGTEAAGGTKMGISAMMAIEPAAPVFVDHPFLFIIREKVSDIIFFMGRVVDPRR